MAIPYVGVKGSGNNPAKVLPLLKFAWSSSFLQGELFPELLFTGDPEEGKRLTLHPAILWKLLNVRAHLAKGKT